MKEEDEDLLEIYDDDHQGSDYDYFETVKAEQVDKAWTLMFIGFMIMFAIKFYQSLPGDGPDPQAIVLRQVELLNLLQSTSDDQLRINAVMEYDSLQNILDAIESN